MKRENFYRRNPDDALSGMVGMTLEERGVYNTIIDLIYLTWRPLEDNRAYIAGHCGCAVQKLNPIINRLIERRKLLRFEEDGVWYVSNRRFEDERAEVKGAGKTRSGRAKVEEKSPGVREKSAGVEENHTLLAHETAQNQSVAPLEKSRVEEKERAKALFVASDDAPVTPSRERKRSYPPEFEIAWKAYPHHPGRSSKPDAAEEWKRLPAAERSELVSAIAKFSPKVGEVCGGKGAPDMARWLKHGKHLGWMTEEDGAIGSDWTESRWAVAVGLWRADGSWDQRLGPTPGQPGCRVPAQLLIQPTTTERVA